MPGISVHVVDISRGVVAAGMTVAVHRVDADDKRRQIASGTIGTDGVLEASELDTPFSAGYYVAVFHVGAYYRSTHAPLPTVPFLDEVAFKFGISDPAAHYHLPFKCTPWGYSCFRGGA